MDFAVIAQKFKELYNHRPRLFRAPGRINLIGEHTDYNEGYVLPASIDKSVVIAIGKNNSESYHFYAHDLKQSFKTNVNSLRFTQLNWPNYLMGVIDQLNKRGHLFDGFDCVFGSDIPIGAGLSSSAAIESGLAFGLNDLFDLKESRLDLVKLSQKAENEFVGVNCGIMDQFASIFGKKDYVFRLDCRSLDYTYFPLELGTIGILLIDTKVKHELASSEYNTRRKECEKGVKRIAIDHPEIISLRDVPLPLLQQYRGKMDPEIFKRCHYVVTENERVLRACEDLSDKKIKDFGAKMYETHKGLQEDYQVTCPELDFLVDQTVNRDEVYGSRMMGGGFGGCTINLVEISGIADLKKEITSTYKDNFGIEPTFYEVEIKDGATEIL
jgi:galactokinase